MLDQVNILSNLWKPIRLCAAGVAFLCALACSGCGDEPDIVHEATGTFYYWPNAEDDVLNLDGEGVACTSEVSNKDNYSGFRRDYLLTVECHGYFKAFWNLPNRESQVADFPVNQAVRYRPSELLYHFPVEGSQFPHDSYWTEQWMERCDAIDEFSGTLVRHEVTNPPIDERFAAIAGTLQFETAQECLSGEIHFEINVSQ